MCKDRLTILHKISLIYFSRKVQLLDLRATFQQSYVLQNCGEKYTLNDLAKHHFVKLKTTVRSIKFWFSADCSLINSIRALYPFLNCLLPLESPPYYFPWANFRSIFIFPFWNSHKNYGNCLMPRDAHARIFYTNCARTSSSSSFCMCSFLRSNHKSVRLAARRRG